MTDLIPSYLELDYNTLKTRLQTLMENSDTFADYNYDGSNISTLIQLMSYISELTTYYSNKLAKNIFPDTAELYNTVSAIANGQGYYPYGYIASQVVLAVTVTFGSEVSPGDQLYTPAWFQIDTGEETTDGDAIVYCTTSPQTITIPTSATGSTYTYNITLKQGEYNILSYEATDIINNKIALPFYKFDSDTEPYTTNPALDLYVNQEIWERVNNFVADISQLDTETTLYMLEYDKYQNYNIKFSSAHTVPSDSDEIDIVILETLGNDGAVAAGTITSFANTNTIPVLTSTGIDTETSYFIRNLTKAVNLSEDNISINNTNASINHSNPQVISGIKQSTNNVASSQYRNVTSSDYIGHLETNTNVTQAYAWGEKEEDPGNTIEYNKVYLSIFPNTWGNSTISVSTSAYHTSSPSVSASLTIPRSYNSTFESTLLEYLAPRRYLNSYETFVVPELVYFGFDIGIKVKRMYNFTNVQTAVKDKLEYYFDSSNREFGEIIDFKEIHNYILDTSEVSATDDFSQVRGVDNLVFRDIFTITPSLSASPGGVTYIYEYNTNNNTPMYTVSAFDSDYENVLRPIQLGFNQFPVVDSNLWTFINEGT